MILRPRVLGGLEESCPDPGGKLKSHLGLKAQSTGSTGVGGGQEGIRGLGWQQGAGVGCRQGAQKFSRSDGREGRPLQSLWVGAGRWPLGRRLVLADRLPWPLGGRENKDTDPEAEQMSCPHGATASRPDHLLR